MKYLQITLFCVAFCFSNSLQSQVKISVSDLPVKVLPTITLSDRPMVLYITGDGGWDNFSKDLGNQFVTDGVPVVALNALKYFWSKRSPEEAAQAFTALMVEYSTYFNKKKILLCGYSFGADVLPFIYNRLPEAMKEKVTCIQLLSPSPYTDFEIHFSYLFMSKKLSVAREVEKINKPIICFYGKEEEDKPLENIRMPNFKVVLLNGRHHYENSFGEIVKKGIEN